ncbi:MAG TPA: tyrosine-type recombinase/integrase [Trueperaceae bacterium]|nr:tyrosine-type recombinase/integrase [Trueperaceae bacterium]
MPATVTSLDLSTATRLQRIERLQKLDDAALRRHAVRAASERDVDALWELVEAHLTLRGASGITTSPHTMRAYRRGVADLVALWQGENLLRPGRDAGSLYVQRLRAGDREPLTAHGPAPRQRGRRPKRGPLAPATVQLKVASARALYDALAWAGATEADPFRNVRMGRQTTKAEDVQSARAYTDFELIDMAAAARDQQERVILLLGSHAGLRVSEMLRLRWEDIDLRRRECLVQGGKGGKTAVVALTPKLAEALMTYRRARQAGGDHGDEVLALRSQYGVFNRLRRLCERASVEFKGVHALRHSAGTRLYRQTGDLGQVQDHLRHATLDMARRYAKSDRRRLRKSLDGWE